MTDSTDKGVRGGACNRTDCQAPGSATSYNTSTRAWYCPECARKINAWSMRDDGVILCIPAQEYDTLALPEVVRDHRRALAALERARAVHAAAAARVTDDRGVVVGTPEDHRAAFAALEAQEAALATVRTTRQALVDAALRAYAPA